MSTRYQLKVIFCQERGYGSYYSEVFNATFLAICREEKNKSRYYVVDIPRTKSVSFIKTLLRHQII